MIITVTEYDPSAMFDSIVVFTGVTTSGETVRFGVDHRMAGPLAAAIDAEGEADASVESWQVLGVVA